MSATTVRAPAPLLQARDRAHRRTAARDGVRGSLGGSFSIGRIVGIDIRLHFTFLIFLGWVVLSHLLEGQGWRPAAAGLLLICCVFAVIVLHELGHALMARRFGIRTHDITLLPIGGMGRLERMPDRPGQELAIALAGPAVNVVLALALWGVIALVHAPFSAPGLRVVGGPFLAKLLWLNVGLAIFNLVPAFPMDGGRVLRAALAMRMEHARATAIAARLGKAVAVLFGFIGLFGNPILIFIALFVWIGAAQEYGLVQLTSALGAVPVTRVMITEFGTLSPDDTLVTAAQRMLAGFQGEFPVLEGERPVGMISRERLMRGIATFGPAARVAEVMNQSFHTVEQIGTAARAAEVMGAENEPVIVMDGPRLAGLVLPEHLAELFVLLQRSPPDPARV